MSSLIISLVIASLLIPAGFEFLTKQAVDYSYLTSVPSITTKSLIPRRIVNNSFGVKTTATNILVADQESGAVLYNRDFLQTVPIASITKLMTALVILDTNPNWDEIVEIREEDHRIGNQVYLLTGETISIKNLFYLMLIASSNEAAIALSRSVGIDNFSEAMNAKAVELGMLGAHFVEPTGLSPDNVATPNDLVILANQAFGRSEITDIVNLAEYNFFTINTKRFVRARSTNQLLGSFLDDNTYKIIGAKTGYLDEAGYCLLMQVSRHDGAVINLVLLGANTIDDRWQEAKGLIDWVFRSYEWPARIVL